MQDQGEAESIVIYSAPDGRTRVLRGHPEVRGDFVVVHRRGGDILIASRVVLEIRPPYVPERDGRVSG